MISSGNLISRKTDFADSTGINYEVVWYVMRRGNGDLFPDGRVVPKGRWSTWKPIWIKLGEGDSWAEAITFGPSIDELENAADDFGAKQIVWLSRRRGNGPHGGGQGHRGWYPKSSNDT